MLYELCGIGHSSLIPITERSKAPFGFAVVQLMLKSYVTVAALHRIGNSSANGARKFDRDMAIVQHDQYYLMNVKCGGR
jgi:hypothetical protein